MRFPEMTGCAQVAELAAAVQAVTGETVELAYVDQGYTGERAAGDAAAAPSSVMASNCRIISRPRAAA